MELLQLRYFLDSARLGSFAKTAEKYAVPASSVSASIRRLEQELGQKLFERGANRVILNSSGKRLQKSVEMIFSELDQTVNDIVYPQNQETIRLLALSMRSRVTAYILEYQKKYPSVCFDTCINYQEENFEDFDIIIGTDDNRYKDYSQFPFSNCRVLMRVAEDHHLAGRELTLKQLENEPFVTMGGNLHEILVSACQKVGFTPNVIARINDISCYTKYLAAGTAIGHCRDQGLGPGNGFVFLNVTDFEAYQQVNVYYKTNASGNVRNFLEFLRNKSN